MRLKLIVAAVLVGLTLLFVTVGPSLVSSLFTAKQEARVAKGQAGAATEAGAEAMNTVSTLTEHAADTDRATKGGIDAINAAPGGDSNDAALRAACGMRVYRDSKQCAGLSAAGAGNAARADPGG